MGPLDKLSLVHPTSWKLKVIALASRVYHAIKIDFSEQVERSVEEQGHEFLGQRLESDWQAIG